MCAPRVELAATLSLQRTIMGLQWCGRVGAAVRGAVFVSAGSIFMIWVWVATFFVGNVLALVSLSFVRPVNQVWHETFVDEMARAGWGTIVDYVEHVGRLSPVITGDLEALNACNHPLHKGSKIVISNHCTAGDPLALFVLGRRLKRIGNMRFMVRKDLLFVPVLGLTAYFLDFVFLSRAWNKDQRNIRQVFRSMLEGTRRRLFWICMFPEGTRITPEKLRDSQKYAASKNMPIFQHVLVPRVKGLQATLESLRADADAVLDVTIAYSVRGSSDAASEKAAGSDATIPDAQPRDGYLANEGAVRPGLADLLLHRRAERSWPLHIHVRALPMTDIPTDEDGVNAWVQGVFAEKDALLGYFNAHGCFPGSPNELPRSTLAQALLGFAIYNTAAAVGAAICLFSWRCFGGLAVN